MIQLTTAEYEELVQARVSLGILIAACKPLAASEDNVRTYQDYDEGTTHRTCCHALIYDGNEPHAEDCDAVKLADVLAVIEKP